jgi:rhomboid protease GluP
MSEGPADYVRIPPRQLADGAMQFRVNFTPPSTPRYGDPESNNLKLIGLGSITVSADAVTVEDEPVGHKQPPDRTFARKSIANVAHSPDLKVVAFQTLNNERHVAMWMQTPEDAQALLALLPREPSPEFLDQQAKIKTFNEHLKALAPKAPVTPTIIGLNVAMFVVMLAAGAGLMATNPAVHIRFGSNFGLLTFTGEPWRLLTSAFIHFGVIHIAFNMYALWNGGVLTERLYGSARYAVIYLLSALAGSVTSSLWNPTGNSAGASGAIFGVYGALLVFFTVRRDDIPMALLKSVRSGALSLCIYSLIIGAANPAIDNAAHIGGLLGGALSGWLLVRPFEPAARTQAQPWRLVWVSAGILVLLTAISSPLWWPGGEKAEQIQRQAGLERFAITEGPIVERLTRILHGADAKEFDRLRAADEIEKEVLKPWHALTQELSERPAMTPADSPDALLAAAYLEYAKARERATILTVQSLKDPSPQNKTEESAAWEEVTRRIAEVARLRDEGP